MNFGKGARRSHPDKIARARGAHEHPAIHRILSAHESAVLPMPPAVDLGKFSPAIFDQGETGACTAHAISGAIVTTLAAAGTPLSFVPSMRVQYALTRARERVLTSMPDTVLPALTDGGAEIADVMAVLAEWGVAPMGAPQDGRYSDVGPANVNDEPGVGELESTRVLDGPYAVDMRASNASNVIAASLVAGIEVDIGFMVDQAFEDIQPGHVARAPVEASSLGGHSVRLSGYLTSPTGDRNFICTNSWSANWCTAGRCLVGPAFMEAIWEAWPVAVRLT